jgi:hypothetical protein
MGTLLINKMAEGMYIATVSEMENNLNYFMFHYSM